MTNAPIRLVVLLGVISLSGVIATQVYWANKVINSQDQQFGHSVQMALRNVVDALCEIDGHDFPSVNPIERVSSNYFVVHTNNRISLDNLEYLLKAELEKRQINQGFEYGVYDCQSEQMVYGDFVAMSEAAFRPKGDLPKLADYDYYFGVYFPENAPSILWGTDIWKFTSGLTVIIVIFFGYALFVILRQKKLSTIQRDFVNNITHEFKTPLATLKVATGVLADPHTQNNTDRLARYGSIITSETERLERHVEQLLKSALIEHRPPVEIVKIDLRVIAEEVTKGFTSRGGSFEIILSDNHPCPILADPYLLQICVYNLVDNAVKYCEKSISLDIRTDGKHGILAVSDDGGKIPAGEEKKIFRKFYRISTGDTHNVKGFGLGLHVVKNAVGRMNGSIHLINGKTFVLKLPLA